MREKRSPFIGRGLRHVWHPCSQMKDYEVFPPVRIVRGKGVFLYDARGNALIDGISSWWVNLFGHCHPALIRALTRQVRKLEHVIFSGFTHDPAVEYADALMRVSPKGLTRVFFADNGSSAVEASLKMSFQSGRQSGRKGRTFLALSGGYHGETLGALSTCGIGLYGKTFKQILMQSIICRGPTCLNCPFGKKRCCCDADCFKFLETAVRRYGPENLCGVIVEPLVQCANRMNMYPPAYLKHLQRLCLKEGIHFIADEIAVGFGRTGKLFACEHGPVSPDILCLSKGITGGVMPFSAVLTTENIYQTFYDDYSTGKAFLHSHSYTGNPLGCALALEVLKIFREEDILRRLAPRILQMEARLNGLSRHPFIVNIRQTGFIGAFDIINPKTGRPFSWRRRMGFLSARRAVEKGALLRPLGDTLYFMPPLTISEGELNRLFDIAEEAVCAVKASLS